MKKPDILKTVVNEIKVPRIPKTPRVPRVPRVLKLPKPPIDIPKVSLLDKIISYVNLLSLWLSTLKFVQYIRIILPKIYGYFIMTLIPFIFTYFFLGKRYLKTLLFLYTVIVTIFFTSWWLDIPLTPEAVFYLLYSAFLSILVKISCCIDSILHFFANIFNYLSNLIQRFRNIFIKNLNDPGFKDFQNKVDVVKIKLGLKKDDLTALDTQDKEDELYEDSFEGIPLSRQHGYVQGTDSTMCNKLAKDYTDTYNKVKDNPTIKASTPDYNDTFFERHKTLIMILLGFTVLFGFSYYMDPEGTKEFFKITYDFYKDIYVNTKNWISSLFSSDGNPKPDGAPDVSKGKGYPKLDKSTSGKHVTFDVDKNIASTSGTTLDNSNTSSSDTRDAVNGKRIDKVTGALANSMLDNFVNSFMETFKGKGKGGSYVPVDHLERMKDNPLVQTEYGQSIEMDDLKGKGSSIQDNSATTSARSYRRRFENALKSGSFTPESQAESRAFQDYLDAKAKLGADNLPKVPSSGTTTTSGIDTQPIGPPNSTESSKSVAGIYTNLNSSEDNNTGTPLNSPASEQGYGEDVVGIRQHKNGFSMLSEANDENNTEGSEYDSDKTPTQSTILEKPKEA